MPSIAQIIDAIKALASSKAAGIGGIPAEFFKAACLLHALIHGAWDNENFPSEWTDGIIIKILKKGDLRECDNWRGICVLPAVSKIIAKVIFEHITHPLISTIDAEQAGSSCTDHITSLRIITEQCREFRSDPHMVFIDFEKAFDSVHLDCIWEDLRSSGIPHKIIAIIKATYNGAECCVLHKGKLSESFEMHSGDVRVASCHLYYFFL